MRRNREFGSPFRPSESKQFFAKAGPTYICHSTAVTVYLESSNPVGHLSISLSPSPSLGTRAKIGPFPHQRKGVMASGQPIFLRAEGLKQVCERCVKIRADSLQHCGRNRPCTQNQEHTAVVMLGVGGLHGWKIRGTRSVYPLCVVVCVHREVCCWLSGHSTAVPESVTPSGIRLRHHGNPLKTPVLLLHISWLDPVPPNSSRV